MQIQELSNYTFDNIETILRSIPFYKEIQQNDAQQFERLLKCSKLVELDPGDTIMRSGDKGSWLYFLIKGELAVFSDVADESRVNLIRPGELIGDLAMLCNLERRATVRCDLNCKSALLFATNFESFGSLEDFSTLNLETKLVLFRMISHNIRWKLEVNKMDNPEHPLIEQIRTIKVCTAPKGSVEELRALSQQAKQLADLLINWNSSLTQARTNANIEPNKGFQTGADKPLMRGPA